MDKRIIKTKENIRKAVLSLMMKKNFYEITVKAIALEANIGRKTFYLHYGSIIDVISEIEDEINTNLQNALEKYIDNTNSYNIENIINDLYEIIEQNKKLFMRIAINDSYSFFLNAFTRVLMNTINNIAIKIYKIDSPHISLYSEFYSAGIIRLYMSRLKGEITLNKDEFIRLVSRCTFEGGASILKSSRKVVD